jgi:hypothetical protein
MTVALADFIGAEAKARQRVALLAQLRLGPVSTIEARDCLGIAQPAARVFDLRRLGYRIGTERVKALDAQGRPHTAARYVLTEGGITHG